MSPAPTASEIDEYGELDRQLALLTPRHKALKARFQAHFESHPADQPAVVHGSIYTLQLSARSKERTIVHQVKAWNILRKKIGLSALIALVKIPLTTAIDQHTTEAEQKTFLIEERSGSRTIKAVAAVKLAAAKASKAA
jgi:hypothetical protein